MLFSLFFTSHIVAFNDCSTFGFGKCQSTKGALECIKAKYPQYYKMLSDKASKSSLYVLYDDKDYELIIHKFSDVQSFLKGKAGADEIALRQIVLQGYYAEIIEEPSCMKLLNGVAVMQKNGALVASKLSLSEIASAKNNQRDRG